MGNEGESESESGGEEMNSEDINTAVNISIIHIHFKPLRHNKEMPVSHFNSHSHLALCCVDKTLVSGHRSRAARCHQLWWELSINQSVYLPIIHLSIYLFIIYLSIYLSFQVFPTRLFTGTTPTHFGHVTDFEMLVLTNCQSSLGWRSWLKFGILLDHSLSVCLFVFLKVKGMKKKNIRRINVRISTFHTIVAIYIDFDSPPSLLLSPPLFTPPTSMLILFLLSPDRVVGNEWTSF